MTDTFISVESVKIDLKGTYLPYLFWTGKFRSFLKAAGCLKTTIEDKTDPFYLILRYYINFISIRHSIEAKRHDLYNHVLNEFNFDTLLKIEFPDNLSIIVVGDERIGIWS